MSGRALDLSLRIKTAMGRALKECDESAGVVAARMSDMLGKEITADALYAYTAPSKPDHDISITRFVAFVHATGAVWLWTALVEEDGLVVMPDAEARLARLGKLRVEARRLEDEIRREESQP